MCGDGSALLGEGESEDGSGSWGEFREGESVGVAEAIVPLRVGEDGPVHGGDPVDAGEVRSGRETFDLEQLRVDLAVHGERDDGLLGAGGNVKVDEREHLAANDFVADQEDEVGAELHLFDEVR